MHVSRDDFQALRRRSAHRAGTLPSVSARRRLTPAIGLMANRNYRDAIRNICWRARGMARRSFKVDD